MPSRIWLPFLCAVCFVHRLSATNVWIDTDPSIGSPIREVDDAFALAAAFHSPEIRIVGISTTYGNAPLPRTTSVAQDLVARFRATGQLTSGGVHEGAKSPRDRLATSATESLSAELRSKRKLTYIALGPLTNLASFLRLHPDRAGQIERVLVVGGRSPETKLAFGPGGVLRVHDANVVKDRAAVRTVLDSKIPVLLLPTQTSAQLILTAKDLRDIGASGPAGTFLFQNSRVWLWFWKDIARLRGGPVFDALAVIAAARPDLLQFEQRFASVTPTGDLVATSNRSPGSRRVSFCTGLKPGTTEFLVRRIRISGRPAKDSTGQ